MNQSTHPSKEQVRQWLQRQIGQHKPPPSPLQIRQELGWKHDCSVPVKHLIAK